MELVTLGSTFQPEDMVENYESLIWTERYSTAGDFQLTSTSVAETIAALPLESYVSLRESTVPMIVELYKIEKPENQAPKITVTGRSFEACALERRASVKSLPSAAARTAWMMNAAKESDAAYQAMRIVLGDTARYKSNTQVLPLLNPAVNVNDAIPEIDLTLPADYDIITWSSTVSYYENDVVAYSGNLYVATSASPNLNQTPDTHPVYWTLVGGLGTLTPVASNAYEITAGNLYTTVMNLLAINFRGIKSVRPLPNDTKVGVEIYNGADLTNLVVFDARFDQIDSATYLLSDQGSADVAYVYGSNGSQQVLKTSAPEPSGLARRVLLVDGTSDTTFNTAAGRNARGLIELYKNNATALFDGQVAQQVAAGYNRDYFLGDILKLVGEYGLSQDVRVTEFIRSSDKDGEKAYPTFEAIS